MQNLQLFFWFCLVIICHNGARKEGWLRYLPQVACNHVSPTFTTCRHRACIISTTHLSSGPCVLLSSIESGLVHLGTPVLFIITSVATVGDQEETKKVVKLDLCFAVWRSCCVSKIADIQAHYAARCGVLWAWSSDIFNAQHHLTTNRLIYKCTQLHTAAANCRDEPALTDHDKELWMIMRFGLIVLLYPNNNINNRLKW